MVKRREVSLSQQQEQELIRVRDHHHKPYLRERAAAILKVASGEAMRQVATSGLYQKRRYETLSEWITRYQELGVQGLHMRQGRGRKPAFSPCGSAKGIRGGPLRGE